MGLAFPLPMRGRSLAYILSNMFAGAIGDSLQERAFGSTPIYAQLGLIGSPFQFIANSGHQGQNILGLVSQFDNAFNALTAPGFAGLPKLGMCFVRIGTNVVRGAENSTGIALSTQNEGNYLDVIDKALTYSEHCVLTPVPPIGGVTKTKNLEVPGYNAFLQSVVAADTTGRLHWIDDCVDLVDGSGNVIADFFDADELHMNGNGAYQMGLTAEPALRALMAEIYGSGWYRNPLVTNPDDVWPNTYQWTTNPTNVGTGGTFGSGWSGQAPNGVNVSTNGAGLVGTVSIVAADVGDPNQVPWMRITPSVAAVANIAITMTGAGRTINSTTPPRLEQMIEVRGNNFTRFNDFRLWMQAGGQKLTPDLRLRLNATAGLNRRLILRQSYHRTDAGAASGTPTNYIYISGASSFSGDMGSIDMRCWSVRG